MPTLPSAAEPAQPKDNARPRQPIVFNWYENKVQDNFERLYRMDVAERRAVLDIMRALEDANVFKELLVNFTDTMDLARESEDFQAERDAILALCARCYIAGTLRDCAVIHG